MKLSIILTTATLVAAGLMNSAMADFMIFPAKGQSNEQLEQEADNYANNRNQYNRAYTACLEGKGYTVK